GVLAWCQSRVFMPSTIECGRNYWICAGHSTVGLFAASNVLKLRGAIPPFRSAAYCFRCSIEGRSDWQQAVQLENQGDFEATLELPAAVVGKEIVLEFKDYGTFRPAETILGSVDTRELGFVLQSVQCLPPVTGS